MKPNAAPATASATTPQRRPPAGGRSLLPRRVLDLERRAFACGSLSSLIISCYLGKAQGTYGSFATVITILWWFYLQAQITLLGAQLNVVLAERLYPRSLVGGPETDADHRALQHYADKATFYEEQEIEMRLARKRDKSGAATR